MAAPSSTLYDRIRVSRDMVIRVFATHLVWAVAAYSQRSGVSFGPYVETATAGSPVAVAVRASSQAPLPSILAAYDGRNGVEEFSLTSGGRCVRTGSYSTARPSSQILLSDIDADGDDELLVLSEDGEHLEILRPGDVHSVRSTYRLEHRAQRMVVSDLDNDGRKDVLYFGRNMAGVGVLLGGRQGSLKPGPLLFPESSVGDLVASDLNGDRITDLVVLHWLSDQLAVYFGIGQFQYSEQVSLALPGEPGRITYMPVQRRQVLRFLVTLPANNAVLHIVGTPAGELALQDTIVVTGSPGAVSLSLINDDQLPDMVVTTSNGLTVALGNTSTTFSTPTVFGPGAASSAWTLADVDGDRKTDIVLADPRGRRIVILGNAQQSGLAAWPAEYATGVRPAAVTVTDWTGDGVEDILVANNGSSSIALFEGKTPGRFVGQRTLAVPGEPEDVRVVRGESPRPWTIITVDPVTEQIGVIRRAERFERSRVLMVPTPMAPRFLMAETDKATGRLIIGIRSGAGTSGTVPLVLLQEISGQQFVERSYRFAQPVAIASMTTGDFSGHGKPDVMLAMRERTARETSVALAPAAQDYDFRKIQRMITLPDSVMGIRLLASGDVDGDGVPDLLLFTGPPARKMYVAHGDSGGMVRLDPRAVDGVDPIDEDGIAVRDVNGDGRADIVYMDGARDGIYTVFGLGPRRLSDPMLILPAGGAEHFALRTSPVNGLIDVIMTHPRKHTLTVHAGAFGQ
jgi:hypothetical protein